MKDNNPKGAEGGQTLAYEELYLNNFSYLTALAYKIISDYTNAEDIVQNIFLDLYDNDKYKKITPPPIHFLRSIVINASIDFIRRRQRANFHHHNILKAAQEVTLDVQESVDHQNYTNTLRRMIDDLPPQAGKVLLMSKYEGKKIAQIAHELDLSERTVEAHLYSAIKKMKNLRKNIEND